MRITVLSGTIETADVCTALRADGIVAIETMRTDARRIFNETLGALGIDPCAEERQGLIHLRVSVKNGAWWTDFFTFTDQYQSDYTESCVADAILKWNSAGSPDKFVATVTQPPAGH